MTKAAKQFLLFIAVLSSLTAQSQSETEPNGTTSSSNTMGSTIYGAIATSGDVDVFSFQVNKPGVLSMNVTQVPANLKITIHMLDPLLRQWITASSTVGGGSLGFSWNACDMGKYYIRIFEPYGSSSASQYKVAASLDISDIYECNNNFDSAKTIALNQQVRAYINAMADRDYFIMTMPDSGILNLSIPTLPSDMRMVLYVYDSTQTLVKKTSVPAFSGTPVSLTTTVKKGKHYIVVEDDNYNASTTQYVLNTAYSITTALSNPTVISEAVKIFPNPSRGEFWIDAGILPQQQKEISLINTEGKVLFSQVTRSSGLLHFNQHLQPGIFIVRIKTNKITLFRKLVVTN
ncbi:MAG: T9SS type A sorting domain-containing protein [Lacibacter sp.]